MSTSIKAPKFDQKKIKTPKKQEEIYKPERLVIYLTSKKQKKVFETLCKALEMNFEVKQPTKEKKYPYDPEFMKEVEKGREAMRAGKKGLKVDLASL